MPRSSGQRSRPGNVGCWLRCRSTGRRQPRPGESGPPSRCGNCRATSPACCSRRRIWRWCGVNRPGRRRFSMSCSCLSLAADGRCDRRLRAGAQTTQHPAEVGQGIRRRTGRRLGTLEIWDDRLVALGSEIIVARVELVAELLARGADGVSGGRRRGTSRHDVQLPQHPAGRSTAPIRIRGVRAAGDRRSIALPTATAALSRESGSTLRRSELERGVTLVGPHRDDLVLELNGMPARGYASHGESWSFALALKIASAMVLRRDSVVGDPVLILDDVFAELDESRRSGWRMRSPDSSRYSSPPRCSATFPRNWPPHTVHIDAGTNRGAP